MLLAAVGSGGTPASGGAGVAQAQALCGMTQAALCETFDQPAGTGNRSGQLNGTLWGVSRAIGGSGANFGQALYDGWATTQLQGCSGSVSVAPPNDIMVCNGQLREAVNDNTDVTVLAMYPKQPFDFGGRTGTIAFDVSNDTQGTHTVWPELWITDQPVPTPFQHFGAFGAARNAVGIRLGAGMPPFEGRNIAANCPDDANSRWTVDSVAVTRNYVVDDQAFGGSARAQFLECVIASSGPGNMNHVEVHVSQNQIDVYATDAGTTSPLHHLASVPNANLTLTRGLVWLEDVHYNADKGGQHNQRQHTFAWDNVGFDGPVLARDLAFDVMDALVPVPNYPGQLNLGWNSAPNSVVPLTVPGVTGIQNAAAAIMTFNFFHYDAPKALNYLVNGHSHTLAWPYPDTQANAWRTLAVPVTLSELLAGTNTVSISSDQQLAVANVDLVLVGAGGAVGAANGGAPVPPTFTPTPLPPIAPSTAVPPTATPLPALASVAAAPFTLTGDARPASVARGSTTSIVASVRSGAASNALVDIEVYGPGGTKVFQKWFDNESFAAGQTRSYTSSWVVPATAAATSYTIKVGVFSLHWGTLYGWNDAAGQVLVS